MDRVAIFVDAGYVFAQGSVLLAGQKLPRSKVLLTEQAAIESFRGLVSEIAPNLQLLRIYWYDGTSTGPSLQHQTLAHLPDVKVRLGFVNSAGEQKGVDSLIITDMIALARNRAIVDAILISGDEDLRVGVQQAQEFGIRVHLIGIKPSRGSQSRTLLQEADTTREWSEQEITKFLKHQPKDTKPFIPTSEIESSSGQLCTEPKIMLNIHAVKIATAIDMNSLKTLIDEFNQTHQIQREIDKQLLGGGRAALGRDLDIGEKRQIREEFITECRRRINI